MLPATWLADRNKRQLGIRLALAAALVGVLLPAVWRLGLLRSHPSQHIPPASTEHDSHLAPLLSDGTNWVDTYDPDSAFNGYTMILFRRRYPVLVDMSGNVVHHWGRARAQGRARLSRDGHLLTMHPDNVIREYDWHGRIVWQFAAPGKDLAHHDVIRLRNGNTLIVYLAVRAGEDYLLEVDPDGQAVWRWGSGEHLSDYFGRHGENPRDKTHINSVQELSDNRWWRGGDQRFRPGNLLVSARALNLVFVIDRQSGAVVWRYDHGLDFQHEALMIQNGHRGAGNILVFNNGYNDRFGYRQSSVLELEPVQGATVWEYSSPYFFSSTGGAQQSLPNGNVLIASSSGGRCFEVTRDGRIVWQLIPPYDPMRPWRYEYDHCPQLRRIQKPPERAEERRDGNAPYVDRELRSYALGNRTRLHKFGDRQRRVVDGATDCRRLIVPAHGVLTLSYGVDPQVLAAHSESDFTVIFHARLECRDSRELIVSFADTLRAGDPRTWRKSTIRLDRHPLRPVVLCLGTEGVDRYGGKLLDRAAMWENPFISSPYERRSRFLGTPTPTEMERRLTRERLEALGYVE
jgi:hypothetical protein